MLEERAEAIAREVLEALQTGRQIEPFSVRRPSLTAREAYAVTAALRRLREKDGAASIGRKIGFTNRGIWDEYGVHEPIWGDVYDTTASEVPPDASPRIFIPAWTSGRSSTRSPGSRTASRSCSPCFPAGASPSPTA
jgi:2-keto-4-pentenoate hydratase